MRKFPDADPGDPGQRSPARYLVWLAGHLRRSLTLAVVYGIIWMLGQALMPAAIGRAIDKGIIARDTSALLAWGGVVLGLGLIQAASGILRHRCAVTNWLGAAYQTVQIITRHVARLGATLPKRVATGEVVSVGVADIAHIGSTMDIIGRAGGAVVAIVVVAALLLTTSVELGLIVLIGVPAMAFLVGLMLRPLHDRQLRLRELQGELTTRAIDIVGGLRVLRGVGGEAMFASRYRDESQRVRRSGVRVARIEALLEGAEVLLPGILVALVVWLGARFVLAGQISAGQLVAFYGYAIFLVIPLRTLTEMADKMMKGYVSAKRVTGVLSLEPEIVSGNGTPPARNGLELADPDSGLVVEPGRFTAVACSAPGDAGEIADRLGRYTDSGATYGGVPLRDLPLEFVRLRVLVAGNDDRLFTGPLNTELDPTGRGRELSHAVNAASAADVIDALPGGLDGMVAEAGREFSGGERQRLRLVRALMAEPEVLILVEPTSAVDAHTEARIAARLGGSRTGRSTVVFTTSPIVLDRADRVCFVDGGRVVAEGTHTALLEEPRYAAVVMREEAA